MIQINFDKIINRDSTNSVKWGLRDTVFGTEDVLPMWVADMDFQPPKEVITALQERLEHGIFGYTYPAGSTAEAIRLWQKKRHGWHFKSDSVLYSPGVVPSIAMAIQAFTDEGDNVLLQSPVYTPFFEMVKKNGRNVINSPLKLIDHRYEIDFEDFEQKLQNGVKLFLLCNPHNPGGRVWTEAELRRIGTLCKQYNCLIISDEIHSDLVYSPHRHFPIASIAEFRDLTVTLIAPTKTFNLAGIQASAVISQNSKRRAEFKAIQAKQGFFSLSTFGIAGMEAAYMHGEKWLEELLSYLKTNINTAKAFIEKHLPQISFVDPEGTYLLWLDCRKLEMNDEQIKKALLEKGKLGLELGPKYGIGGEKFVRMNIACPREILLDGLNRLKTAFT